MSDEQILEGSDAGERPLLSYRQSWLAWAGPVLMLLVCVALCVAGQHYLPEFFWIFAGLAALLVLCMGYRIAQVRSVHLYADSKGVWLYQGILPWSRGAVGVKWRDMEDAAFTAGFSSWLVNSYTVRVGNRFSQQSEILVHNIANGREAVTRLNELQGRFCGRSDRRDD